MSLESIEKTLGIARALLQPTNSLFSSYFESDGLTPKRFLPGELVNPVVEEIRKTPHLLEFSNGWFGTPQGGERLTDYVVASALVRRLFESAHPKAIVLDFINLMQAKTSKYCTYVGLYGDEITRSFEIGDGVAVMPPTMAPPSFEREYIFQIDRLNRPIHDFGRVRVRSPSVALTIIENAEISRSSDQPLGDKLFSIGERVDRAIRALTLASGHAFSRGWQTSRLLHPAIPYDGFNGISASGTFEPIPQLRANQKISPVAPDLLRLAFQQLDTMSPELTAPINLAIDRLRRSRTHTPSADTALDLGIASEIICCIM